MERSITLDCYFNVIGRLSHHEHKCFFRVTDSKYYDLFLHTNNTVFKNPQEIDFRRYTVKPLVGYIANGEKTYTNTKIEFVKMNEKRSTLGNVVSEVCYSDNGSKYYAFIEPGLYDINIFVNNQRTTKRNIDIKNALNFQYYKTVNGLIRKKYKDTVMFCGTDYKMVFGELVDNKNTPIVNAEIIVINKDNSVNTYIKTDEDGKYSFAIKNGKYKVKIRSQFSTVKTTDIEIDDRNGFYEQLTSDSILFSKKSMLRL